MTATMIDCEGANVDAVLSEFGRTHPVAGYVSGGYPVEWTEPQFAEFPRKIRIYQQPWIPGEDTTARVLDVENGAARPADWPLFYSTRQAKYQAMPYCSLTTVPAVVDACRFDSVPYPDRWWLAWYWGEDVPPSRDQVLAELFRLTGIQLTPAKLWGCQWAAEPGGQPWDLTAVYGTPDFARH